MSDYITVAGIVQFDPRTRQAGDKQVRDIAIRSIADQKMYNVTLWPEKANTSVAKGDFVVADGKYTASAGQNKAGEQVTWHNLSANTFHNLVAGASAPMESAGKPAATGDDFPF
jgi:hypothetical protein